jgi:hypothetical protein
MSLWLRIGFYQERTDVHSIGANDSHPRQQPHPTYGALRLNREGRKVQVLLIRPRLARSLGEGTGSKSQAMTSPRPPAKRRKARVVDNGLTIIADGGTSPVME